jgi:hypothetical protein
MSPASAATERGLFRERESEKNGNWSADWVVLTVWPPVPVEPADAAGAIETSHEAIRAIIAPNTADPGEVATAMPRDPSSARSSPRSKRPPEN